METEKKKEEILEWIEKNRSKLGIHDKGKYSTMLALSTCDNIYSILNDEKDRERNNECRFLIDKCIIKLDFIGDMIYIAKMWKYLKDEKRQNFVYFQLKDNIRKALVDNGNRMDTIDKLICLPILSLEKEIETEIVSDAIKELSNIKYWKYNLVKNPMYCRKIHNSFHYASPYFLLYNLSDLQSKISILPMDAEKQIETVIIDGYTNFEHLNILDASLLLSATPIKYQNLVYKILPEFIKKIETDEISKIPYYYDSVQFKGYIKSEVYTASAIYKALATSAKFSWKPFVNEEKKINMTEVKSHIFKAISVKNGKISKMNMKGCCMEPYLSEGDNIYVSYDYSELIIGDIVVFRYYDGRIMAHRVIDIIAKEDKKAIITAADNGGLWGYPVFERDIIGKVVKICKRG